MAAGKNSLMPGEIVSPRLLAAPRGEVFAAIRDPAEGERVRTFVIPANEQNLDRLAAHLSQPPAKS